jgi:hypothetical protein
MVLSIHGARSLVDQCSIHFLAGAFIVAVGQNHIDVEIPSQIRGLNIAD